MVGAYGNQYRFAELNIVQVYGQILMVMGVLLVLGLLYGRCCIDCLFMLFMDLYELPGLIHPGWAFVLGKVIAEQFHLLDRFIPISRIIISFVSYWKLYLGPYYYILTWHKLKYFNGHLLSCKESSSSHWAIHFRVWTGTPFFPPNFSSLAKLSC